MSGEGAACPICGTVGLDVEQRRQNTAHADDALNWVVSCLDCFDNIQAEWAAEYDDSNAPLDEDGGWTPEEQG